MSEISASRTEEDGASRPSACGRQDPTDNRERVLLRKRKRSKHPLRELRVQCGYTLEELSEITSLSPSYLSRLESGSRRLNADILSILSEALNCHPGDLLVAQQTPVRSFSQYGSVSATKDLPLYPISSAGTDPYVMRFEAASEWVTRPTELQGVTGAFAFLLNDQSLTPRYCKGDRVYVHPSSPLTHLCSVLVITQLNQAYVGRFIDWFQENGDDLIVLEIAKQDGAELFKNKIKLPKSDIKATYRVIGLLESGS